ncbi:MAG: aldehyde dehydrogenase family protein [Caulobacter sp.]|nr:aldehyde dehydrogenase family protein [Caulobacter sp.]
MTLTLSCHIGGASRSLPSALEQRNPSSLDEVVAVLPDAGNPEIADASAAARAALAPLGAGIERRAEALDQIGAAIAADRTDLARLIARETGKTVSDAEGEVLRAARIFRFFGGEALRVVGERFASVRPGVTVEVSYLPLGVIGAITPWNFPVAIPAWKIAPAIAYGNAVVWKPSEHASAVASRLMDIIAGSDLPAGTVNMVLGGRAAGEALTAEGDLDGLSFTGSEATGQAVALACARRRIRVQAEMGGVNGLIVLADANLDAAVDGALNGAFFAAGQRCTATSRIIVEREVAKAFAAKLVERMAALRVGDPLDPATQIGPLVSMRQKSSVQAAVTAMVKTGGSPLQTGRRDDAPACFVDPVLFDDLAVDDLLAREEVFGPVAGLMVARNYDDALDTLNAVRFGLCGGIYTSSLKQAEHFKLNARVGMAMVNLPTAGVDYHAPFGGTKASSLGPREQGRAARDFFTVTRTAYQAAI